jgi:hypothetical protein
MHLSQRYWVGIRLSPRPQFGAAAGFALFLLLSTSRFNPPPRPHLSFKGWFLVQLQRHRVTVALTKLPYIPPGVKSSPMGRCKCSNALFKLCSNGEMAEGDSGFAGWRVDVASVVSCI